MKLTSKERVMLALSHKEPDRVPIDLNGHRSSGISVQAYKKLREYLGLKVGDIYIYDVPQQLAVVEDDILDIFDVDVVQQGTEFYKDSSYWKDWQMHDGSYVKIPKFIDIQQTSEGDFEILGDKGQQLCIQKKDCLYFEQTYFPLEYNDFEEYGNVSSVIQNIMWGKVATPPAPLSFEGEDLVKRVDLAKKLRMSTERAIYGMFGGSLFELGQQSYGMENFLCDLVAEPEKMHMYLDRLLEHHMKQLEVYMKHIGPYVDIIGVSDDLGMQTGPQISEDMFCEFLKPRYKVMWSYIKKIKPEAKICMHCCGGVEPLVSHLTEAGLDGFNPVQTNCVGMNPKHLKTKYGKEMFFWGGGCDTRDILPKGTPDDVRRNVRENMRVFKSGGGFVFQQIHNILADVPAENIVALLEAAKEYGRY